MWKYSENNAYDSISLHDCRTDNIRIDGNDLVLDFPDGFWILPVSKHSNHDRPLKTGPSQLRFQGFDMDSVDLFKTTYLFWKPVLCRRIRMETPDFLRILNAGKHELEFLYEYHSSIDTLYKCWLWKKDRGMEAECELALIVKNIEYNWNEICRQREW